MIPMERYFFFAYRFYCNFSIMFNILFALFLRYLIQVLSGFLEIGSLRSDSISYGTQNKDFLGLFLFFWTFFYSVFKIVSEKNQEALLFRIYLFSFAFVRCYISEKPIGQIALILKIRFLSENKSRFLLPKSGIEYLWDQKYFDFGYHPVKRNYENKYDLDQSDPIPFHQWT